MTMVNVLSCHRKFVFANEKSLEHMLNAAGEVAKLVFGMGGNPHIYQSFSRISAAYPAAQE
jgi:hypothetical protein